jgi:hypothetical protein
MTTACPWARLPHELKSTDGRFRAARCRCMFSVRDGHELRGRRRRPERPSAGAPPRHPRPRGGGDTSGQAPGPKTSTLLEI